METVLTAIIIIFLVLFAVLTLSDAIIGTQDALAVSWQALEARRDEQSNTQLSFVESYSTDGGTFVTLVLRNSGTKKIVDFARWDVILQYYDADSAYHIEWLAFRDGVPAANEWTIDGIYLDASKGTDEAYDPGILNPGEEIVLSAKIAPSIAAETAIQTTVSVASGVNATANFTGNALPVMDANLGIMIASGGQSTISTAELAASDPDDAAVTLIYTVTMPPEQGTLSPGDTFTQADIDGGLLDYAHTGSGGDSFQFSVSDGKDSIGDFTFVITVNEPPVLTTNDGLTITNHTSGAIGDLLLAVTDDDDAPADIVYTVLHGPFQGLLSLDSTFTQQDILDGSVAYTHFGTGNDSFEFTVSDGVSTIGPYTFAITVN